MPYFVYALQSERDGRLYIGMTRDVQKRLRQHNAGKTQSTRFYRPYILLRFAEVPDRLAARALEKEWKSGSGRAFIK